MEEKYNSHTLKKSGRKGEGTHSNKPLRERNVFIDVMSNSESKEFSNSNMAARDTIDDEIIFQKEIHSKYIRNVHKNQTVSMMRLMELKIKTQVILFPILQIWGGWHGSIKKKC